MNRNALKFIAVVSMLVDHVGKVFFPSLLVLRIIGRLAFPIFAFFIAEGFYYTKNFKKYLGLMLLFAFISAVPHSLLFVHKIYFNILFTFSFSLLLLKLLKNFNLKETYNKILSSFFIFLLLLFVIILDLLGILEYGVIGVLLPVALYLTRNNKPLLSVIFATLMLLLTVKDVWLKGAINFVSYLQLFSLIALVLILLYNGKKGKFNLKYFFYIFYPLHLALLLGISYII